MSDPIIVSCVIHPGIGVARLGNSPEEYFIGPEVPGARPNINRFKDDSGRIKRQAARFRIYGLDSDGNAVKELTAADADITWTVHLANKKSAWYCFNYAMDIPEAQPVPRRNGDYAGDRNDLIIDPGARTISGPDAAAQFDSGKFMGAEVCLGEIRTDSDGRLLVFGGLGQSGSPSNKPLTNSPLGVCFDNKEWYDDISDGPVSAQVVIDGKSIDVTPAWVIVGPPNYAPALTSLVTLYDIAYEVAINNKWLAAPAQVSFTEHVYPIFERLCNLQWVNEGFFLQFGWGSPDHVAHTKNVESLASNSREHYDSRQAVFKKFRNPDYKTEQPYALPHMYGDAMTYPPTNSPRTWLALTPLQYGWLKSWADGDFVEDWHSAERPRPEKLEDLPVNMRPQALDRAALDGCLGGAFHPGCEATWTMRQPMLYSAPFRIKALPADAPEKDYGVTLTPAAALAADGPLNGSGPGDITRWMNVPWQADAAGCGAGYNPKISPYLPTFWPARVPNQVLTERSYRWLMDSTSDPVQRFKFFNLREDWMRDLTILLSYMDRIGQFITGWGKMGIVVLKQGPGDSELLPSEVYVETENGYESGSEERYSLVNPWTHR